MVIPLDHFNYQSTGGSSISPNDMVAGRAEPGGAVVRLHLLLLTDQLTPRAATRSENPGGLVVLGTGGDNVPPWLRYG